MAVLALQQEVATAKFYVDIHSLTMTSIADNG